MKAEPSNEESSAAVNANRFTVAAPAQTSSGIIQNTSVGAFTAQDVITYIFQLVALAIALIFGAWAIKSYDAAEAANTLSLVQNQLALLAYCQSTSLSQADLTICNGINSALALDSIASSLSISFPYLPFTNPTTSSTAVSTTASSLVVPPSPPLPPASTTTQEPTSTSTPSDLSVPPSSAASYPASSTPADTFIITITSEPSSASTTSVTSPNPSNTTSPNPGNTPTPGESSSAAPLSLGAIVGIVVGVVAFFGSVIGFCVWRYGGPRRRFVRSNDA